MEEKELRKNMCLINCHVESIDEALKKLEKKKIIIRNIKNKQQRGSKYVETLSWFEKIIKYHVEKIKIRLGKKTQEAIFQDGDDFSKVRENE